MTSKTYLEPSNNYAVTPLPLPVAQRAAEFEASHEGAEILTVYHVEGDKWQFSYALNRGTKKHQELNYKLSVQS